MENGRVTNGNIKERLETTVGNKKNYRNHKERKKQRRERETQRQTQRPKSLIFTIGSETLKPKLTPRQRSVRELPQSQSTLVSTLPAGFVINGIICLAGDLLMPLSTR
ncbi:hypothetical protein PTKIN_Ptkin04bG0240800 [Pterospermum kingtungense]